MARDDPQMKLRLSEALKERVTEAAKANNRSVNAEIVSRLERYDSLGGEVDAMWEVARALAAAIDDACGYEKADGPLVEQINDAFEAVDENGELDRAKLARRYSEAASGRLSKTMEGWINIPPALKERIRLRARHHGRTVDREILNTLELEYPAPADVMHVHLDNIRRALEIYEKETDPKQRLYWQTMVEGMITGGDALRIEWDEELGEDE